MNLLLRLAAVLIGLLVRRQGLGPLDESAVAFRVWPNDLDLNRHMNNGRYLALMDLGRVDLMGRIGVMRVALRRGWRPVIGSAAIRFRRSLRPFETYRLRSRVVCWDDKWFFIEQRFERGDTVAAVGLVKGLMRSRDGNVPTAEVLRSVGVSLPSPPAPAAIRLWQEADALVE